MDELDFVKPDYGKKYPGAGWMRHMQTVCIGRDIRFTTGKRVLQFIQDKEIEAKDVCIVQEESNPDGLLLADLGANKSVITCLESPLYASRFYDSPKDELFYEWCDSLLFDGGTEHLHFPSFDTADIRTPIPWADRKFLCMVTANKHYSGLADKVRESPSFQWAMKTQLQDYRYKAIAHFGPVQCFDLYGRGWPFVTFNCDDKLKTTSYYKFSLCFENGSYPGYITEKIIDCFAAGVVPVYMGAPDIDKYIPKGLFIDARQFKDFTEMDHYLREHQDVNLMHMVRDAQEWLRVGNGMKYNNLTFAKKILEMCDGG